MRKVRFIGAWLTIFSILTVFSFFFIYHVGGFDKNTALADTIASNPDLQNSSNLVDVSSNQAGSSGADVNNGLTQDNYGSQNICVVNTAQFEILKQDFGATIKKVTYGRQQIKYVLVPRWSGATANKIKLVIHESRCYVVQSYNFFYLFYKGELS